MPEAFAQIGQAYQPNGQRPIPQGWPKQNPVSWADTPDPATGMTPRQLGQGVIGAGKEIPQLMRAGLPQGDVVGQTQNPMANTAIGRVLNRYLFDPMTVRGPAQQTGARMMDVLSLLHGMSPVGMEEAVPRVPRYAEDFPVGSEEWWKPDWKPDVETLRSISNDQKRLYQLQQALLNRARRGEKAIPYEHLPLSVRTRALPPEAPGGAPMTPEETAKYPNIVERPPSGAAYPPGSIGAEAQRTGGGQVPIPEGYRITNEGGGYTVRNQDNQLMGQFRTREEAERELAEAYKDSRKLAGEAAKAPPGTKYVRRPGPPEGINPMDLFEIKLNSLGPLGEYMGMKVSPINQKAYHVYDSWYGHLLGGFDTHEEAIEFINRAINSPVTEELPPRDIQSWKWPEEYLERTPRDHKGLLSPKNPPKYEFGAGDYYPSNGNGH